MGRSNKHLFIAFQAVLLIVLIQILSVTAKTPLIPTFYSVAKTAIAITLSGEILPHVVESLRTVSTGYAVACFLGIGLSIMLYQFNKIPNIALPTVDFLRNISAIALIPAVIVFLGIGFPAKVFIIFWTAFPSVLLNTYGSFIGADKDVLGAAKMDGCGPVSILKILIPLSLQQVATGLRIGLSGAWISLVAAEMLASNKGLGFYIMIQSQSFSYKKMYAGIVIVGIIGFLTNRAMYLIQRRLDYEK